MGNIYAQKLFCMPKLSIVRYQGMIPALKYMVATINLYQSFLFHKVSLVNIYPKNAAMITVRIVPRIVLSSETTNAWKSPSIWKTPLHLFFVNMRRKSCILPQNMRRIASVLATQEQEKSHFLRRIATLLIVQNEICHFNQRQQTNRNKMLFRIGWS